MDDESQNLATSVAVPSGINASEIKIEYVVAEFEKRRMSHKKSIKEFHMRLTTAVRELSGAYHQDSLIKRLISGLSWDVRDMLQLEDSKCKGAAALTKRFEMATAYHSSRQWVILEKLKLEIRLNFSWVTRRASRISLVKLV